MFRERHEGHTVFKERHERFTGNVHRTAGGGGIRTGESHP